MSAADRAKKLKEKFVGLGTPPARDEIKGALSDALARGRPGRKRKAEKMAQLNLRVPEELKHRLRILATRDRREMSDIVIEAITLYEARFGAAPVLEPRREELSAPMRWLFLVIGGIATAAMLLISMWLNFLFGYSLGQTPEKALVFGCVSVISDAWKGLGPIFILALYRAKRQWSVVGAAAIWVVCFSYSISSALGVAIEDRSSRTGSRETILMNYDETVAEEKRLEEKRKGLRRHRSAAELEAAINTALLRPVELSQRIRGAVGELPTTATAPIRARPRAVPRLRICARSLRRRTRNAISIDGCRS